MPRKSNLEQYLQKLQSYYFKNNSIPNFEITKDLFGLSSKGSVHKIFNQLLELGFLQKDGNKFFPTSKFTSLPMFESIRAGVPCFATDEHRDDININSHLIENPNNTVLLKVKGDSMQDEGIFEGDVVIVDKAISPSIGDIVVAVVDGDYTMKYYMKDKTGKFFLRAANDNYEDIYPQSSMEFFGVVISFFRKYK